MGRFGHRRQDWVIAIGQSRRRLFPAHVRRRMDLRPDPRALGGPPFGSRGGNAIGSGHHADRNGRSSAMGHSTVRGASNNSSDNRNRFGGAWVTDTCRDRGGRICARAVPSWLFCQLFERPWRHITGYVPAFCSNASARHAGAVSRVGAISRHAHRVSWLKIGQLRPIFLVPEHRSESRNRRERP